MEKRKIAIVGTCPSWQLAPLKDDKWEKWGVCGLFTADVVWDRWFELHKPEHARAVMGKDYVDWMAARTLPTYLHYEHPQIPTSRKFPFEYLIDKFGPYFTSSVGWLAAFAIVLCEAGMYDEIGVWGVDMESGTEYQVQRANLEALLYYAKAKGIKITIPPECQLLKAAHLYGYQDMPETVVRATAKHKELHDRLEEAKRKLEDTKFEFGYLTGATDQADYFLKHWRHEYNV